MTRAALTHRVLFWEEFAWADFAEPKVTLTPSPEEIIVALPQMPRELDSAEIDAVTRRLLNASLAALGEPAVAWFYTPMMLSFADGLRPAVTVYDCMDELSAFRGAPPRMLELEKRLLARADLVFAGGRSLYEAKRDRHRQVHCFLSSIDAGHFAAARAPRPDPTDQAGIPHPRIGLFGVIDERMDMELIVGLADARPAWHFVMLGPVVNIDPAILPRRPNLHWLGPQSHATLPDYLAGWQLGFMPFALNESTRFISPTKTPEFLAAGLPVVSTPVTDVVRDYGEAGLVEIAAGPEAFALAIKALLERPREAWLRSVDRRLATQSWDATWEGMEARICQASSNGTVTPWATSPVSTATPQVRHV